VNRRSLAYACLALLAGCSKPAAAPPHGPPLTQAQAVALAERFVVENGYTAQAAKGGRLDSESLDTILGLARSEQLQLRSGSLVGKAIGAKPLNHRQEPGWSIAFDYAGQPGDPERCRVVTMDRDGAHIAIQHVDGFRSYFAGFQ
jgi:hypothetical protein